VVFGLLDEIQVAHGDGVHIAGGRLYLQKGLQWHALGTV
jgi:hypothetical protein